MDILARAQAMQAQGKDVVHMEIGEPDFSSPRPIIEAGIAALQNNITHYTPATGLPELREQISSYYQTILSNNVDANEIIITPGASGALQLILAYLLRDSARLMIADPNYPCNRNLPQLFNSSVYTIPVTAKDHFQLSAQLLEQHWQDDVAAVLIASPANPTGAICANDELLKMADFLAERNRYLIVDEIYQGLTYKQGAQSVAGQRNNIFVLNSFSKYFGMTGWRVGWLAAPQQHVDKLDALAQNTYLATSTPGQYAALAAFTDETIEILEQRRKIFLQRRDYLCGALGDLQIEVPVIPDGAFYIYANIEKFTDNSFEFCQKLLETTGVAITPGCDFGQYLAEQHVRFAFTTDEKCLSEAVQRIQAFIV